MRGSNSMISSTESKGNHKQVLKALVPYLWVKGRRDLKLRVVLAMAAMITAKLIGVYTPFFFKDAVDALSLPTGPEAILVAVPVGMIIGYGLFRILSLFMAEIRDAIFVRVGQHALRKVALDIFNHLHNLSLDYHLGRKTGGLSRIIERGTRGIDFLLRFMLFNIVPTLLEIALVAGVFWITFGIEYMAIALTCIVSYIYFTFTTTEWRIQFRRAMNDQDTAANTSAIDSFLNFETVKYFTNEDHEANRYNVSLKAYEDAAVKSQTSLTFLNVGQGAIISVGLMIILYMAAKEVIDGKLTIGEFVLVNSLLIQIYMPLNFLGTVYRSIKQSLTDMENMFDVMDVNPDVQDAKDATPLPKGPGAIHFDQVEFHYRSNRKILKGLSFSVPAGTTTAVVGSSGAGKSTLSRLLFRFYDVTKGSITVDDINIQTVSQRSLRAAIGVVPQDTVLFNDTIRYNIAYGRPECNEAEIVEAAKGARIHDFIVSLPDGYDTLVGERGLKLSGGEKQRVAIARTLLKNPGILVLDEATSALDSQTEREIQQSLKDISKGRTSLIIAHRLSTIIHADQILVMEGGEIKERGTHTELIAAGGLYAAMWAKQQENTA